MFQGLALPRTGTVNVQMMLQQDYCQCPYSIATDGRMTIRNGWDVFIENNGLNIGMNVFMAFQMLSRVLAMFLTSLP